MSYVSIKDPVFVSYVRPRYLTIIYAEESKHLTRKSEKMTQYECCTQEGVVTNFRIGAVIQRMSLKDYLGDYQDPDRYLVKGIIMTYFGLYINGTHDMHHFMASFELSQRTL